MTKRIWTRRNCLDSVVECLRIIVDELDGILAENFVGKPKHFPKQIGSECYVSLSGDKIPLNGSAVFEFRGAIKLIFLWE